jgi:hypothetical protein
MPKSSDTASDKEDAPVKTIDAPLQSFMFPNIGNGVTIQAKTLEEAQAIAAKLR